MKQSKLFELLVTLSKPELKEFEKFLASPYFNTRSDVIGLFQILRQQMDTNDPNQDKEALHELLFPHQSYDEKKLRYTMSFLYQLLKSYLAQKEVEQDHFLLQTLSLKALRKRKIQRVFDIEWVAAQRALELQPLRNMDFHYAGYSLYNEQLYDTIAKSRTASAGFSQMTKELSDYFCANILHQSCLALSYKTIAGQKPVPTFLPLVLEMIKQNGPPDSPAVAIYYHCYLMLSGEESLVNFRHLRQLMVDNRQAFTLHELKDLQILALNFCIRKVNEGNEDFKSETFELYKAGLETGLFLEDKQLSRFTYKNIVTSGLGLNQFEWVRQFIEEYHPYLDKKYRQSAYCFNLALYHFRRSEYPEAMLLLQQVGTDDLLNNLNARRILLRIYFDIGEFEALDSLLGSFQTYIYRKKDLGYHRSFYLNLIKYTRKLMYLDKNDRTQVNALRSEIETNDRVYEKQWLLEKIGA